MSLWFRRSSQVLIDLAILSIALWLAFLVRYDWQIPPRMFRRIVVVWPYIAALQYLCMMAFAVPRFAWRYVGLREAGRIALAAGTAGALLLALRLGAEEIRDLHYRIRYALVPIGVIAIDMLLVFIGITGARALRRVLGERVETSRRRVPVPAVPTLLIGAGEAGLLLAKEIASRPDLGIDPVGFLDDDPAKKGSVVHGIPVLGATSDLGGLVGDLGAEQVLITIAHVTGRDIRRITALCDEAGIPAKIIPPMHDIVAGRVGLNRIRPVAIEDLLRRPAIDLDTEAVENAIRGKVVLVTGAGGSIGSELCRQLTRFSPSRLVLVEQAENALFEIHRELAAGHTDARVVPCVADICDPARIESLFRTHRPQVVYHAAAHKHVPMMELNVCEAVKNNVMGTRTVADAASRHGVQAFVMISTDKAVRPTSVMGATKRAAELYIQALAAESETRFVSVRFGNVLGSTGSVVPIFQQQIAAGGPVTVTDPGMERYFMTIPEASQLVMQAGTMGSHHATFILNMGEPVKIVDLARDLIRLSGLNQDDVEIEFSGVRPGEKLFEELSAVGQPEPTNNPDILMERGGPVSLEAVRRGLDELTDEVSRADDHGVRRTLDKLIPEETSLLPPASAEDVNLSSGRL